MVGLPDVGLDSVPVIGKDGLQVIRRLRPLGLQTNRLIFHHALDHGSNQAGIAIGQQAIAIELLQGKLCHKKKAFSGP